MCCSMYGARAARATCGLRVGLLSATCENVSRSFSLDPPIDQVRCPSRLPSSVTSTGGRDEGHRGRRRPRVPGGRRLSAHGAGVCGCAGRGSVVQVTSGKARRCDSAVMNDCAHGHRSGRRSDQSPGSVDEAPGNGEHPGADVAGDGQAIVGLDDRRVAAVQRNRLWASTAQASQAALAKNRPDGQCSSPAPSFRSRMASSTVAWARWNRSASTVSQLEVGDEGVVAPVRPELGAAPGR